MPYPRMGAGLDNPMWQPPRAVPPPPTPPRPGIFGGTPYRPKPDPLMIPGLQAMGQGDVLSEDMYSGEPILGTASYSGPRLNTETALVGLKAAGIQQPWQQRSEAIGRIGSTGRPSDLALAEALGKDYTTDYADPRVAQTQADIQGLHPATQAREEAASIRGSYPAEASARGQVAAADIAAQAREFAAEYGLSEAEANATAQMASAALKGLSDIETIPEQSGFGEEDREMVAERQRAMLEMFLRRLGYGGIPQGR